MERPVYKRGRYVVDMLSRTPPLVRAGRVLLMTRQEYYEKYDDHAKLNLGQKHRLEHLVNEIVVLLRNAGMSHGEGAEPMSDVNELRFQFPADGEFEGFGLELGQYGSCGVVVAMEPEPGGEAAEEHVMNEEGRARTP